MLARSPRKAHRFPLVLSQNKIPHYLKADFLTSALGIQTGNMIGSRVFVFVPEEFQEKTNKIIEEISGN